MTPLFRRLLLSYSLISVVPLATVWVVLAVWGNALVAEYLRTSQERSIEEAVRETDRIIARYRDVALDLTRHPLARQAVRVPENEFSGELELELYETLYAAIADDLSMVDVHITDTDSRRVFSSSSYPARYRLNDYRNRRDFVGGGSMQLVLNPRDEDATRSIALSIWAAIPEGYVIIDIRNDAIWEALEIRSTSEVYLVDQRAFRAYHVSTSGDGAQFAEKPELGIAFGDESFRRPTSELIVGRGDLSVGGFALVMTTELFTYFDTLRAILEVGALIVVSIAAVVLMVAIHVSRSISRPIHGVVHAMSHDPGGPQPLSVATLPRQKSDELNQLVVHYNRMVETIGELIRKVRDEEQAQRVAERRALESRIQPHFLYNTLGSIKSMAKLGDTAAVTTMVTDLGKMLRFVLSDTTTKVTLGESIDQIRRYLGIQKVRFQDRMHVRFDLDPETLSFEVPKLLVQPLVENAVLHAVEVSTSVVDIRLVTERTAHHLLIRVEDNGLGPNTARSEFDWEDAEGIGLRNVRERLLLFYGERAELTLSREHGITTAMIRIAI
jgi:two-component system sensor histidine kinase YesM